MPRKEKKYHYIYKTTNLINKKYYIGMHSTDNLDDGYIGSGKRLWNSINYHGKENFKVEILEYYKNRKALRERETEIVNEELINDGLCMNLVIGGGGGAQPPEIQRKWIDAGKEAYLKKFKEDVEFRNNMLEALREGVKQAHKDGKYRYDNFKGMKHSEESKLKMSEAKTGKGKGSNNSQYGSCWITNESENEKISKGDLIPEGWRLGRVIK